MPQVLPVTMFLGSFAWPFVFVSLPFRIVVSRIAQHAGGAAIGVINSAAIGLACVPLVGMGGTRP